MLSQSDLVAALLARRLAEFGYDAWCTLRDGGKTWTIQAVAWDQDHKDRQHVGFGYSVDSIDRMLAGSVTNLEAFVARKAEEMKHAMELAKAKATWKAKAQ